MARERTTAQDRLALQIEWTGTPEIGPAWEVTEVGEKLLAIDALIEYVVPGRSSEVRRASREDILRTLVLAIPLDEASAKVRIGPPIDDDEDYALDIWAGVIPLRTVAAPPVTDPRATQSYQRGSKRVVRI